MTETKHTATPHLFIDPSMPGCARLVEDPTAGFLLGVKCHQIVRACNAHDDLVILVEKAKENEESLSGNPYYQGAVDWDFINKCEEVLAKAKAVQ